MHVRWQWDVGTRLPKRGDGQSGRMEHAEIALLHAPRTTTSPTDMRQDRPLSAHSEHGHSLSVSPGSPSAGRLSQVGSGALIQFSLQPVPFLCKSNSATGARAVLFQAVLSRRSKGGIPVSFFKVSGAFYFLTSLNLPAALFNKSTARLFALLPDVGLNSLLCF